jgi:hypothetical protein
MVSDLMSTPLDFAPPWRFYVIDNYGDGCHWPAPHHCLADGIFQVAVLLADRLLPRRTVDARRATRASASLLGSWRRSGQHWLARVSRAAGAAVGAMPPPLGEQGAGYGWPPAACWPTAPTHTLA